MADTQQSKVVLYWLEASRSQRMIWMLEECKGIEYEIKVFKRQSNKLAPPELKEIHPLGKSPVISVESSATPKPLVLAESGAICEYLCDYFSQHLVPKRYQEGKEGQVGGETEQWLRYRHYMHYAEGSLMTILLIAFFMDQIKNGSPWFIKPITTGIAGQVENLYLNQNFKTHFGFLESQLASSPDGGEYLCGKELTAADVMMSYPLTLGRSKIDKQAFPKLIAYIEMLEKHEGYVGSIKKIEKLSGEPFKLMP